MFLRGLLQDIQRDFFFRIFQGFLKSFLRTFPLHVLSISFGISSEIPFRLLSLSHPGFPLGNSSRPSLSHFFKDVSRNFRDFSRVFLTEHFQVYLSVLFEGFSRNKKSLLMKWMKDCTMLSTSLNWNISISFAIQYAFHWRHLFLGHFRDKLLWRLSGVLGWFHNGFKRVLHSWWRLRGKF